jgi:hypothetical protein
MSAFIIHKFFSFVKCSLSCDHHSGFKCCFLAGHILELSVKLICIYIIVSCFKTAVKRFMSLCSRSLVSGSSLGPVFGSCLWVILVR